MSDFEGNIDDLIREGFDSSDDGFDFGSWNDIEQKLNNKVELDHQIAQAFDQIPEEMPVSAWPQISEELDINTVWKRINVRLNKKKRRGIFWWNAAAIALLLLLAGFVYKDKLYTDNDTSYKGDNEIEFIETNGNTNYINQENNVLDVNNQTDNSLNLDGLISESFETQNSGQEATSIDQLIVENSTTGNLNLNSSNSTVNNQGNVDLSNNGVQTSFDSEIEVMNKMAYSPIIKLSQPTFDGELPEIEINPSNGNGNKPPYPRRWVVGAFSTVESNLLSDALSRDGLKSTSLTSNNFTASLSYGIYGQYYTKNNFFVESEFYLNSRTKRSTNEYRGFDYTKQLLRLDYYQLSVSFGKSLQFKKFDHIWFNPSVGIYGSIYKRGKQFVDDQLISSSLDYKSFNYGLQVNLGIQHEYNRWVLGYGLHSSFGLTNIFAGNDQQSANLNVSRTVTNGLYLRLGFKL